MNTGSINKISLKCVNIEILAENTKASLGFASGSLCKFRNRLFVITNWHVVSGRNFQTGNLIHNSGAIPGFLKIELHSIREAELDSFHHDEAEINLELYESHIENGIETFTDKPLYKTHPTFKHHVDVVALEVTDLFKKHPDIKIIVFDIEKDVSNIDLIVMDEVFIVGFPLKTSLTPNKYPIYKNATIASEPDAYEHLPIFYIDGKTKKGMSGSPVIRRRKQELKRNGNNHAIVVPEQIDLIGIYSGRERQESDEYQAELGIVWRIKECLLPILENAIS